VRPALADTDRVNRSRTTHVTTTQPAPADDPTDDFEQCRGAHIPAEQVAQVECRLASFYRAVERLIRHDGTDGSVGYTERPAAVRAAFARHHPGGTNFDGVSAVLQGMPDNWPGPYRAAVVYYLSPLIAAQIEGSDSMAARLPRSCWLPTRTFTERDARGAGNAACPTP
jgi:hypothetical protein